jgi:pyroglutamyl-peptidase
LKNRKQTGATGAASRPLRILITGFGPFPGAPFNPTGALVEHLTRTRRPALAVTERIRRVFPTSYAILDHDFPDLLTEHRPDIVLMFGLAARTRHIRIETTARNVLSASLPDVSGARPAQTRLALAGPATLRTAAPCHRFLQAIKAARVPAALSRNAGRYLCNALYWRALEALAQPGGPKLAVFIHVPKVRRYPIPGARLRGRSVSMADLCRAGEAILLATLAAARRR